MILGCRKTLNSLKRFLADFLNGKGLAFSLDCVANKTKKRDLRAVLSILADYFVAWYEIKEYTKDHCFIDFNTFSI